MSSNEQPRPSETMIPLQPLIDWLNEQGVDINALRDRLNQNASEIAASPTDASELSPRQARIERAIGELGARQAWHGDLAGLLIALSADNSGQLDDVRAFEDSADSE